MNPSPSGVSLVFCGAAGQGLQTIEDAVAHSLSYAGQHLFTTREVMSRVRGGMNSSALRIASKPVRGITDRIDYLFLLSGGLRPNVAARITEQTHIFGDANAVGEEIKSLGFDMTDIELAARAKEAGGSLYEGMIVAGIVTALYTLPESCADTFIDLKFGSKPDIAAKNKTAFRMGHAFGLALPQKIRPSAEIGNRKKERVFMDGNTAIGLGAAAAGCNFAVAYPMSPGTALFGFFAKNAARFGAVVEQVEDELAAVNMAIGASYAGAKSLVSTSGGGFALMCEGISLAGMTETSLVIHLAQRPGPATGMATRTEQGDLELALHAGHGDFPRALFTPGSVESCFTIAAHAFDVANRFQTPVILLTDQYLLESGYDIVSPDPDNIATLQKADKTTPDYKRYALTPNGISPLGIPGYGEGLISADSHEHTESGHISEDFDLRLRMTEKRFKKLAAMKAEALDPVFFGPTDFKTLIVGWGSTMEILKEAFEISLLENTALVCCEQVYPISPKLEQLLLEAEKTVFVENNATGQFARLVRAETGVTATKKILKYNGLPFSVEELAAELALIHTQQNREGGFLS